MVNMWPLYQLPQHQTDKLTHSNQDRNFTNEAKLKWNTGRVGLSVVDLASNYAPFSYFYKAVEPQMGF